MIQVHAKSQFAKEMKKHFPVVEAVTSTNVNVCVGRVGKTLHKWIEEIDGITYYCACVIMPDDTVRSLIYHLRMTAARLTEIDTAATCTVDYKADDLRVVRMALVERLKKRLTPEGLKELGSKIFFSGAAVSLKGRGHAPEGNGYTIAYRARVEKDEEWTIFLEKNARKSAVYDANRIVVDDVNVPPADQLNKLLDMIARGSVWKDPGLTAPINMRVMSILFMPMETSKGDSKDAIGTANNGSGSKDVESAKGGTGKADAAREPATTL